MLQGGQALKPWSETDYPKYELHERPYIRPPPPQYASVVPRPPPPRYGQHLVAPRQAPPQDSTVYTTTIKVNGYNNNGFTTNQHRAYQQGHVAQNGGYHMISQPIPNDTYQISLPVQNGAYKPKTSAGNGAIGGVVIHKSLQATGSINNGQGQSQFNNGQGQNQLSLASAQRNRRMLRDPYLRNKFKFQTRPKLPTIEEDQWSMDSDRSSASSGTFRKNKQSKRKSGLGMLPKGTKNRGKDAIHPLHRAPAGEGSGQQDPPWVLSNGYSLDPEEVTLEYSLRKRKKRKKLWICVFVIVGLLILGLAASGVAIYLAVRAFKDDNINPGISSTARSTITIPSIHLILSMKLYKRNFTSAYSDKTSLQFESLQKEFCDTIQLAHDKQPDLQDIYKSCYIVNISPGSIKVEADLEYDGDQSSLDPENVQETIRDFIQDSQSKFITKYGPDSKTIRVSKSKDISNATVSMRDVSTRSTRQHFSTQKTVLGAETSTYKGEHSTKTLFKTSQQTTKTQSTTPLTTIRSTVRSTSTTGKGETSVIYKKTTSTTSPDHTSITTLHTRTSSPPPTTETSKIPIIITVMETPTASPTSTETTFLSTWMSSIFKSTMRVTTSVPNVKTPSNIGTNFGGTSTLMTSSTSRSTVTPSVPMIQTTSRTDIDTTISTASSSAQVTSIKPPVESTKAEQLNIKTTVPPTEKHTTKQPEVVNTTMTTKKRFPEQVVSKEILSGQETTEPTKQTDPVIHTTKSTTVVETFTVIKTLKPVETLTTVTTRKENISQTSAIPSDKPTEDSSKIYHSNKTTTTINHPVSDTTTPYTEQTINIFTSRASSLSTQDISSTSSVGQTSATPHKLTTGGATSTTTKDIPSTKHATTHQTVYTTVPVKTTLLTELTSRLDANKTVSITTPMQVSNITRAPYPGTDNSYISPRHISTKRSVFRSTLMKRTIDETKSTGRLDSFTPSLPSTINFKRTGATESTKASVPPVKTDNVTQENPTFHESTSSNRTITRKTEAKTTVVPSQTTNASITSAESYPPVGTLNITKTNLPRSESTSNPLQTSRSRTLDSSVSNPRGETTATTGRNRIVNSSITPTVTVNSQTEKTLPSTTNTTLQPLQTTFPPSSTIAVSSTPIGSGKITQSLNQSTQYSLSMLSNETLTSTVTKSMGETTSLESNITKVSNNNTTSTSPYQFKSATSVVMPVETTTQQPMSATSNKPTVTTDSNTTRLETQYNTQERFKLSTILNTGGNSTTTHPVPPTTGAPSMKTSAIVPSSSLVIKKLAITSIAPSLASRKSTAFSYITGLSHRHTRLNVTDSVTNSTHSQKIPSLEPTITPRSKKSSTISPSLTSSTSSSVTSGSTLQAGRPATKSDKPVKISASVNPADVSYTTGSSSIKLKTSIQLIRKSTTKTTTTSSIKNLISTAMETHALTNYTDDATLASPSSSLRNTTAHEKTSHSTEEVKTTPIFGQKNNFTSPNFHTTKSIGKEESSLTSRKSESTTEQSVMSTTKSGMSILSHSVISDHSRNNVDTTRSMRLTDVTSAKVKDWLTQSSMKATQQDSRTMNIKDVKSVNVTEPQKIQTATQKPNTAKRVTTGSPTTTDDKEMTNKTLTTTKVEIVHQNTDKPVQETRLGETTTKAGQGVGRLNITSTVAVHGVDAMNTTSTMDGQGVDRFNTTSTMAGQEVGRLNTTSTMAGQGVDRINITSTIDGQGVDRMSTTSTIDGQGVDRINITSTIDGQGVDKKNTTSTMDSPGVDEMN